MAVALAAGCCSTSTVSLHPQVRALPGARSVELDGQIACRQGFLEQLVCAKGTRDHEALVVTTAPASVVHAALLASGLHAGAPGAWSRDGDGSIRLQPPRGDRVEVLVRWSDADGPHEQPLTDWALDTRATPGGSSGEFVFAGSGFRRMPDGSERYLADGSGSIVGLVTFGDEVVAMREVIPDRVDVAPASWKARTDRMPAEGSAVTVVIRPAGQP